MQKMKTLYQCNFMIFVIFFCIVVPGVPAARTQNNLQVDLDLAQFQDAKHQSYLEICYALGGLSDAYVPNSRGGLTCKLVMDLHVYKDDSLWASKVWKVENSLADTTELEVNNQILDMFRYYVEDSGKFRVAIYVKDINHETVQDSTVKEIAIRKFSENLEVSDAQVASKIARSGPESAETFVKNNYEILPNPTLVFGENAPTLYYYFEIYNLQNNVPGTKYKSLAYLRDSNGAVVEGLGSLFRTKKKVYDTGVEMGVINVASMATGPYFLVFGVADSADARVVKSEKKIYVYNPAVAVNVAAQATTPARARSQSFGDLDKMASTELDMEYEMLSYLTTKEERNFYKNITNPDAKRQIIYKTWEAQPGEEGVKGMQYRSLYLLRAQEANERFKETGKQGWHTDRGRVLILYGPPSDIERFPSTGANKPYQIWRYDNLRSQGAVEFVFADRYGFNKFELVHSNLRGELQDPFWQRYVLVGPQESIR
jgi:GWxTD domain-containing protein